MTLLNQMTELQKLKIRELMEQFVDAYSWDNVVPEYVTNKAYESRRSCGIAFDPDMGWTVIAVNPIEMVYCDYDEAWRLL